MQYILYFILFVIVGICFAFYHSILFLLLFLTPEAPTDSKITISNYDSFQIYSREYSRDTKDIKRSYLLEPIKSTVFQPVTGDLVYRSTLDGDVCIIDKKDDDKFGNYGEGVDRVCESGGITKNKHWAVNGCRNNAIGCGVKVTVRYDFFVEAMDGAFNSELIIKRK